jgi:hypothetical protein
MYMEKNTGAKHWAALDYKVASDYTYGSPEYYRNKLRQSFGMNKLLAGEQNENPESENFRKRSNTEIPK